MKNFKTFLIAVLLLSIMPVSFLLCACTPKTDEDKKDHQYNEVSGNHENVEPYSLVLTQFYLKDNNPYITDYFDNENRLNLTTKINSIEELKAFCLDKQWQLFDSSNAKFKNDNVSKKLKTYDEDFFNNHSIVLLLRFKETSNYYSNCLVDIKEDEMNINLISSNTTSTTALRTQIRILEISKDIAQKVNQIKVQENLCELDQEVGIKIYEDNNLFKKDNAPTSFIINSVEELNNFCNEETSPYFQKNYLTIQDVYPPEFLTDDILNNEDFIKQFDEMFNNRNKRIINILKKYDIEFFESKTLILLFRYRASTGYFYRFDNFEIDETELNINLIRKLPNEPVFYPTESTNCIYIMELAKEKSVNIKQININEIEIQ